jgi:hypothetical protein
MLKAGGILLFCKIATQSKFWRKILKSLAFLFCMSRTTPSPWTNSLSSPGREASFSWKPPFLSEKGSLAAENNHLRAWFLTYYLDATHHKKKTKEKFILFN